MANTTVKSAATQAGALKKNSVAVLGVFGPKAELQALVRLSSGRVKKVKHGNRVGSGKVVAIDEEGVVLRQSGQNRRIDIPGS
ncbi:pilus assembly protein PilP [uncultured Ruegeria sp.]|uniref:pilus assembly protein PilP n=1 Tax=uncultured Ruegeria sp. TaxID=259304 RepID=UPI002636DC55|nr:pilus assembly protein PilP [uncultured Ruegeria sp.]